VKSFRSILIVIGLVSAFFACRYFFLFRVHDISRAHLTTYFIAFLAVLGFRNIYAQRNKMELFCSAFSIGFIAASVSGVPLGIEIANRVQKLYPEYWNWNNDLGWFIQIIAVVGVSGGMIGILVETVVILIRRYRTLGGRLRPESTVPQP